jgi:hypothetical protein
MLQGISLYRVAEVADITPEPDGDERAAILAALAAEAATEHGPSGWADALLPGREGEHGEPYPE